MYTVLVICFVAFVIVLGALARLVGCVISPEIRRRVARRPILHILWGLAAIAGVLLYLAASSPPPPPSQAKACINNLRLLDAGKEQAAMALGWTYGTPVDAGSAAETNALQYVKNNTMPSCPANGTYTWNPIGIDPTCSIGTNATPAHTL